MIQGQINVISSNADLQVNELLTQANTTATQTLAKATAEGNAAIIEAEVLFLKICYLFIYFFVKGVAYKDFLNSTHGLNFTEKELMQYFYIKNVRISITINLSLLKIKRSWLMHKLRLEAFLIARFLMLKHEILICFNMEK